MTLTVEEAATNLGDLIEKAAQNREEIVLTQGNRSVATLRPNMIILPSSPSRKRNPGTARGLITIAPDFDAPLDDFADYE